MLRAGGNAVDAAVACVLMSFVAESPLTGPGAGGFMLVHVPDGGTHLLDFFVAAPGKGIDDPRARRADADRRLLLGGRDPALQRRPLVLRRLRHHARARARARALRRRVARRAHRSGGARRARGRRGGADAGLPVHGARADPALLAGMRCDLRARRAAAARGRHDPAARSSATCSSASAPRGPAFSTRATRQRASATGCSSAAASSRAKTSPPTRCSSARPRAWRIGAARCSPIRRRRRAAS